MATSGRVSDGRRRSSLATALAARLVAVSFAELAPHGTIVVNLLAGSLMGAYLGANWATRMAARNLYGSWPFCSC